LIDETGADAGTGEIGELVVRGNSSATGYWQQPEKSGQVFRDGWTWTGDKYTRDAQGYYHYCGRADDMLKVSGQWVSPFEVEAALVQFPAIQEAAVVGAQDENGLVKPRAYVVLKPGFSADEALVASIQDFVKHRIAPHKYPRWIDFVPALPKTATGKIQRFRLRA
jgi:acyl-coenzyme A synthetase/AMP-(fatty) acid ligase